MTFIVTWEEVVVGPVDTNPEEALEAPTVALLATLISNNNGSPLIIVVIQRRLAILKPKRRWLQRRKRQSRWICS
jgi:hypothetical protein